MAQLVYILGIINLVGLILIFFSCRCLVGKRAFNFLNRFSWYQKFYRSHCWWWYVFFASVFLHAVLAMMVYGNPF